LIKPLPCSGEIPEWAGNLFVYLGGQYYIVPDFAGTLSPSVAEHYGVSGGLIKPYPGLRAGAGYHLGPWQFSLESGYSYIKGDNPLVLDIHLIPLLVKTGYVFHPTEKLSLGPVLEIGAVFARVNHYESAIALLLGRPVLSSATGLLAYAGAQGAWNFTRAFALHTALGVEAIIETGGILPLPSVELGLSLRPFLISRKKPPAPAEILRESEPPEAIPAPIPGEPMIFEDAEAAIPEPIIVEEIPERVRTLRILNAVYFEPDTAVLIEIHRFVLDALGQMLISRPDSTVILRAYSAPYSTREGQLMVSQWRADFCRDYLETNYGIDAERMSVECYGADRLPEWRPEGGEIAEASEPPHEFLRCVEFFIEDYDDLE
jgi:outer membrane protein OmpA-like peptidoglycan-associated protein